jgi:hypothetical protein
MLYIRDPELFHLTTECFHLLDNTPDFPYPQPLETQSIPYFNEPDMFTFNIYVQYFCFSASGLCHIKQQSPVSSILLVQASIF